ncbi:YHYH domain-containing protein [Vibrio alginolyticus]|nr:YHYH domain-containing protein [Vibrio alginolyticus]ULF80205.1 YHYH domain-containing protein [Vibrio alginolyticus]
MKKAVFVLLVSFGMVSAAFAHSGGTDANGCHTNSKTSEYHCHNRK